MTPTWLSRCVWALLLILSSGCHPFEDIGDYPFAEDLLDTSGTSDVGHDATVDVDETSPDGVEPDTTPADAIEVDAVDAGCECADAKLSTWKCVEGACVYKCVEGAVECDSDPLNGCNSLATNQNCGECGVACGDGTTCQEGSCVPLCGAEPCPEPAVCCSGVCTVLDTIPNCGKCGQACDGGACVAGTCEPTCNGILCADGEVCCSSTCVTLGTTENCLTCGDACELGPGDALADCTDTGCAFECKVGWDDCDQTPGCETNLAHAETCGSCTNDCTALDNVTGVTCEPTTATCAYTCEPGFDDCDTVPGCETDLSDPASCGTCGNNCLDDPNSVDADCSTGGVCSYVCSDGWANCDADALGCETALDWQVLHCSACGNDCTAHQNVLAATCGGGLCSYLCKTGFDDCDDTVDGCETSLRTSPDHCGTCGNSCSGNQVCMAGQCVGTMVCGASTCFEPEICCNNACINPDTNRRHCGDCNMACGLDQTCLSGTCTSMNTTCNVSGGCSNDTCCDVLCVDLNTDPTHCGDCFKSCDTGQTCVDGECK